MYKISVFESNHNSHVVTSVGSVGHTNTVNDVHAVFVILRTDNISVVGLYHNVPATTPSAEISEGSVVDETNTSLVQLPVPATGVPSELYDGSCANRFVSTIEILDVGVSVDEVITIAVPVTFRAALL